MKNNYKEYLRTKTLLRYRFIRCIHGLVNTVHQTKPKLIMGSYTAIVFLCGFMLRQYISSQTVDLLHNIWKSFYEVFFPICVFTGFIFLLINLGTPKNANNINECLYRIGLENHAGEVPLLLKHEVSPDDRNIKILEFDSNGISRDVWEDSQASIEAILNVYIAEIEQGSNNRMIRLKAVSAETGLPELIPWKPELLTHDEFTLVLGMSFTGHVLVNLSKIPHILIGGSTGSGKSILLKLLLMQCINKGANVYIADFKGGVDFSPIWHDKCNIIIDEKSLLNILTDIVNELEIRKKLLKNSGYPNISEYNKNAFGNLPRIIFGCDEIAEVLDKTGLSKGEKDIVSQIESKLSIIARQGRAFGIHLIIATQRPDANILSGQIKNNIDFRVCGRADNILSQIILDKADANDKIPKNAQGMFLTNNDVIFKSYMIDDKNNFI